MSLCHICELIQWEDLPPFPEELYERNATGLQHIHNLFPKSHPTREQLKTRGRYHGSLAELSLAAAAGCELCLLVKAQADALLAEIGGLSGIQRELEGNMPTFNMWLTKRPGGGAGFWILSEGQQDPNLEPEPPSTLLIAAFGFSATDGKLWY